METARKYMRRILAYVEGVQICIRIRRFSNRESLFGRNRLPTQIRRGSFISSPNARAIGFPMRSASEQHEPVRLLLKIGGNITL